jgi:hypothetical protein
MATDSFGVGRVLGDENLQKARSVIAPLNKILEGDSEDLRTKAP